MSVVRVRDKAEKTNESPPENSVRHRYIDTPPNRNPMFSARECYLRIEARYIKSKNQKSKKAKENSPKMPSLLERAQNSPNVDRNAIVAIAHTRHSQLNWPLARGSCSSFNVTAPFCPTFGYLTSCPPLATKMPLCERRHTVVKQRKKPTRSAAMVDAGAPKETGEAVPGQARCQAVANDVCLNRSLSRCISSSDGLNLGFFGLSWISTPVL
jgi:hypothetical protein